MPESRKRRTHQAKVGRGRRIQRIDPRAPWKRSWWVLWGFLTVVGELVLIFLARGQQAGLSLFQVIVIGICIPFVAHLLVSAVRTVLILIAR